MEFSKSPLSLWLFNRISLFSQTLNFFNRSFDSSVGRAEDCRSVVDILRSLVGIRLEGIFYFLNITDSSHATYSKLFCGISAYITIFFSFLIFVKLRLLVIF